MSGLLGSSSLTNALSEALREQIVSGEIVPGRRLTEAWVSGRFEVARPTAKAGIDRLVNEGVLRRGPRRSAMVPELSADDVRDIYFSREPVESRAVETLAQDSRVPEDAEVALALMRIAAERDAHADHTKADVAFHRALVAATSSTRLARMHEVVMGETQLCIAQVRAESDVDLVQLTANHAAILDGIRSGVASEAVSALHADLHGCRDMLLRSLERGEE